MSSDAPRRSPRAALIVVFAAVFVTIFARRKEEARPQPAEPPAAVAVSALQQLRWLEGDWVGSGGGIGAFYERYRFLNDSTIAKYGLKDSTGTVSDSSEIALRATVLRSGDSERSWVAVGLDSSSVRFAPERNAANAFEFRRTGPASWTARLTWDSAGVPKERVYEMRALSPRP